MEARHPTFSDFYSAMEEFGFLEHEDAVVPPEFSLVYEIARVFENDEHPLTERLSPIFWQRDPSEKERAPDIKPPIPILTYGEEYETDILRHYNELPHIYAYQFLLPESVFDQKLAERTLWLPRAQPPNNYSFRTESDAFAPDSRKQKAYVLFDTSASMIQSHRINLAKAIAFYFLRANKQELGLIFFRTFDIEIGELFIAKDERTYNALMSKIVHIVSLGNGTALARAIQTAADDIRAYDELSEAQILVITDGAVHLDEEKIRATLGKTITLNCVKIGRDRAMPNRLYLRDQIALGGSEQAKLLRKMQDRESELRRQIGSAGSVQRKHAIEQELLVLRQRSEQEMQRFAQNTDESYGREIETISNVFVEVDDLVSEDIFRLPETHIREIGSMTAEMVRTLSDHARAEDVKKGALLYNRLQDLLPHNPDAADTLGENKDALEKLLKEYLEKTEQGKSEGHMPFNLMDQKQIFLLMKTLRSGQRRSLSDMIKYALRMMRRAYKLWRQRRRMRV